VNIEVLPLLGALAVGVALGLMHFGGLWLTVRRLPGARHPRLLTLGSTLGRLGVSLLGFYGVAMHGGWGALLVCLGGFLGLRSLLLRASLHHAP
jgi:F1F0 ATPase subunit 2